MELIKRLGQSAEDHINKRLPNSPVKARVKTKHGDIHVGKIRHVKTKHSASWFEIDGDLIIPEHQIVSVEAIASED